MSVRERLNARPRNLSVHKLHRIGPIRPVNDLGSDFIASSGLEMSRVAIARLARAK